MSDTQLWIIGGMALLVVEIFTPGFIVGAFGVACFAAALVAFIGFGSEIQLLAFAAASFVLFVQARSIVLAYLTPQESSLKTGVQALIGQAALVTEDIDNLSGKGRVLVRGESWKASSTDGKTIQAQTKVHIERAEGVTLFVRPQQ